MPIIGQLLLTGARGLGCRLAALWARVGRGSFDFVGDYGAGVWACERGVRQKQRQFLFRSVQRDDNAHEGFESGVRPLSTCECSLEVAIGRNSDFCFVGKALLGDSPRGAYSSEPVCEVSDYFDVCSRGAHMPILAGAPGVFGEVATHRSTKEAWLRSRDDVRA